MAALAGGSGTMSVCLDPRDAAIHATLPMVMAPRYGDIEPLSIGSKRLVAAANGIFLEVRSPAVHARVLLQEMETPLPYGVAETFVRLTAGAVPVALLHEAVDRAVEACPNETALAVMLDPSGTSYVIEDVPIDDASPLSVRYTDQLDDDRLVFDIHTHGNATAHFSCIDDDSDRSRRGPYIALVLGTCAERNETTFNARLCCSPYLVALPVHALPSMGVVA
jgi:PRTRC genetic system protein A